MVSPHLTLPSDPLWLYLHFPALQLDKLDSENTQPIAIIDKKTMRLCQCNSAALAVGIQPGLGLASAAAMCHSLELHPYHLEHTESLLAGVAQWLYLVTAEICLIPPCGLLLRVTPMLKLYHSVEHYWAMIEHHLRCQNVRYCAALGHTPLAAKLLALSKHTTTVANVSHNAYQRDGDDAQSQAALPFFLGHHRDDWYAIIAKQSLEHAELSERHKDMLRRVGINTLGALLKLSLTELARRFDIEVVNYIGRLTGQLKHPHSFYRPPEQFSLCQELLYEYDNVQWLTRPLTRALEQLERFLKWRDALAYELTLTLHHREHVNTAVVFHAAQGEYLACKWMTLATLQLESLRLPAPIIRFTLELTRHGMQQGTSCDLLSQQSGQMSSLELISVLQAKLGGDAVLRPRLISDPRPEKASLLVNALDVQRSEESSHHHANQKQSRLSEAQEQQTHTLTRRLRPSFLLPEPEPLNDTIALMNGPERIVSGWWDGDAIMRDYYIARTEHGQWLWIFRDPFKRWFCHGFFA
ncbi:DNA polymerase Y family protein [Vibrio sp. SM6]|uniref:DNA polymerase Y family protein n=1 Tax=Vibrio agarilyticus TaxID=2726741 RepID=A0A7X8TMW7_9VIBR|nr:DNA polymerase Y family protein [Vibrio agarilyticus]NLS11489.1 DNA polymerase Y family protein [Vibrio agarilyticus]